MNPVDWDDLERRYAGARTLNDQYQAVEALSAFRSLVAELADTTAHSLYENETRSRLLVRSRLGLALATYENTVDLEMTTSMLDRAADEAEAAPESIRRGLVGLVSGQRGVILMRSGQFGASLPAISASLAAHDEDDLRSRAIDHLNRGVALIQIGRLGEALEDLEWARRLAEEDRNARTQSFALHNLGYVRHLMGDLPGALMAMEDALAALPDESTAIDRLGRAEVLFEGGLVAAAEELLTTTIPDLAAARLRPERAEAEYYRAKCLLILNRFEEAARLAATARRHYERVGHEARAVLARVLELEAMLEPARRSPTLARTARRRATSALVVAQEGDTAGPVLGLDPGHAARLVAVQWFLRAGDVDAAQTALAQLPRRLTTAPLSLRIQHYTAQAELAFATGDRAKGVRAVRSGLSLLADHRSRLGSVESVTAAAAHGVDLTRLDVEAAARSRRPAALFDALERGRATFAGTGRVTPPEDPEAAALLTEARGLLAKAREIGAANPRERERLTRRAARIQDEVRERSWRHAGNAGAVQRPVTSKELRAVLDRRSDDTTVVANYLVMDGMLRCVRVDAQGVTSYDVAPEKTITESVRRLGADFAMAANHLIPPPLRAAARASLERNLKTIDDLLLVPLAAQGDLYIVAREPLLSVPWSSLPSRSGLRTAVNSHVARGRAHARPSGKRRLLAAAGPGVEHGTAEARAVGEQWPGATVLTGEDAVTERVRTALATHDVVHLATHGQHDADNPLFASIDLADGPLFAHELDGTPLPGSVVILSSCEVGGSTQVLGGELLGLTSVLLRLGARAVIASVAKLSDELAARVMPRLHAHLRETDDPEAALAAALADVAEPVPLVCFSSVEGLSAD
ncbi:CHAT domain-containing protein [Promicromonospora thailandica]|uniref:CHAT domain-containing protein n=1 Tax=Promicromonospora thailandica TaxID=765201 RepID=A0A9X2G0F1_9MICO|nr:CHAT domain-containing protein [Promicromonospora thailandica]